MRAAVDAYWRIVMKLPGTERESGIRPITANLVKLIKLLN